MKPVALLNPAAGRGRGIARIQRFRELLDAAFDEVRYEETTAPGQEAARLDAALADGCDCVIAVGGDGTWSIVADYLLRRGLGGLPLGLLPAGTGNDFGKSLGITFDRSQEIVAAIAARRVRRVDVGRVDGRHFLNVVGMGFDIAVIHDAASVSWLKGDLLYRFCALRQLFRYRGVEFAVDAVEAVGAGEPGPSVPHLMLVVANGQYFGGSFHIAPEGSLFDGTLDAVSIHDAGPLRRAGLFQKVGRGRHLEDAKVRVRSATRLRIGFDGPLEYELDGEVLRAAGDCITIECLPAALSVCTPQGKVGEHRP